MRSTCLTAVRRGLVATALALACGSVGGQTCRFIGGGSALSFPLLDPSLPVTVTAFADISVICVPLATTPAWQFTGVNGNSPLRMKHVTQNSFIPYSVGVTRTGTGVVQSWRLTATVLGPNYENAFAGSFSDVLTATIAP